MIQEGRLAQRELLETPAQWSFVKLAGVLSGGGAEAAGDAGPFGCVSEGLWQMDHNAAHRFFNPGGEFQQVLAQGGDLGAGPASCVWLAV